MLIWHHRLRDHCGVIEPSRQRHSTRTETRRTSRPPSSATWNDTVHVVHLRRRSVRMVVDDKFASQAFGDQCSRSIHRRRFGAPHLSTTSKAESVAATAPPARFGQVRARGNALLLRSRLPWPRDSAPTPRRRTPRIWRRKAGRRRRRRDERGRSAQRRPPSELPLNKTRLRIPTVSTFSAPKAASRRIVPPTELDQSACPAHSI